MRTQDPNILEAAYNNYAPKISFPPYTAPAGIQVVLDDLATARADAKGRKPQEFMNEEVLRELDKQNFFKMVGK